MSLADAVATQFRLVDAITATFRERALLDGADLGLMDSASPTFTRSVEEVIARFFGAGDALLVHGAGTGALREALATVLAPGGRILVHAPGPYFTTDATLRMMAAREIRVDINDLALVVEAATQVDAILLQHTHQLPTDHYRIAEVIGAIRRVSSAPIVVDDNYAALKAPLVGCQLGADLSAFSTFKLFGPEGVGCLVGDRGLIESTRARNPSGGNAVQGPTARLVLEGLVQAPVQLAIQEEVAREVADRIGGLPGVATAWVGNLAETTVIVQLTEPVARQVIEASAILGAADRPVATESRHEIAPLVYRVSKVMLGTDPDAANHAFRVNPLRAGPDTVVRIVSAALAQVLAAPASDDRGDVSPESSER